MATEFAVHDLLRGREPVVASIYDALKKTAARLGPFKEEAKKTSIHLVRSTAFAGVATRKASIVLTLKSATDIKSPRVTKHEQVSAGPHLAQPREWVAFYQALAAQGTPGAFLEGFICLSFGSIIVAFHNVWHGPGLVLTLIGWAQVLKGIGRFLAPQLALRVMKRASPGTSGLAGWSPWL